MKMTTRSLLSGAAIGGLSTIAFAFAPMGSAQAATITTLRNTGVNSSGGLLGDGVADTNYTLLSAPTGANTGVVARTNPNAPVWTAPNGTSQWIGPNTNSVFDDVAGIYTYRTTFDLSGLIASTAQITGQFSADDRATDILLNGVSLGLSTGGGYGGSTFTPFSISSNFVEGINTLDFIVVNDPSGIDGINPIGLRVELAGTAAAQAIPEPSEMLGTVVALGSVVLLKRKLTKKKLG